MDTETAQMNIKQNSGDVLNQQSEIPSGDLESSQPFKNNMKSPKKNDKTKILISFIILLIILCGVACLIYFLTKHPHEEKDLTKLNPNGIENALNQTINENSENNNKTNNDKNNKNINENNSSTNESNKNDSNKIKDVKSYETFINIINFDPAFQNLPEEKQTFYKLGFFNQLKEYSKRKRLLQSSDSSDDSIMYFAALNKSENYFLTVNSTKTKEANLQVNSDYDESFTEETDEIETEPQTKIENYSMYYICFDSSNTSIFMRVILVNLTEKAHDSNNNENTDENSDTEDNDSDVTMDDLINTWKDSDTSKKTSLLAEFTEKMLFYIMTCELSRFGGIKVCQKPDLLSDELYQIMVNGLYLYYPDFKVQNTNIFYNGQLDSEKSEEKKYNSKDSKVSQEIDININEDDDSVSSSVDKNMENSDTQSGSGVYGSQTSYKSKSIVDPYSGRVLTASSQSNFHYFAMNTQNLSKESEDLVKNLRANSEITTFFNETNDLDDIVMDIYQDYWNTLTFTSYEDPVNNMPKQKNDTDNQTNSSNNTANESRIIQSSPLISEKNFQLFNKNVGGVTTRGDFEVKCYYDNYCYTKLTLDLIFIKIVKNFNPLKIYAVRRFYTGFSFLKVVVLENILRFSDLSIEIMGKIVDVAAFFLYVSKDTIQEILRFWEARKEVLEESLGKFTKNLNDMLNFSQILFPVIDQEMVQMTKDIGGNFETEQDSENKIYYNKLMDILPYLQSEILNFQQKLPYVNFTSEDISKIMNNIDNLFLNRYDQLASEVISYSKEWAPQIQQYGPGIIEKISSIIPENDIFHFQEAFEKLNYDFLKYLQIENNLTNLVNKTEDELQTSYVNFQNIHQGNNVTQRQLIVDNLNVLKSDIQNRGEPTDTAFSQTYKEEIFNSSMFLNDVAFENVFIVQKPQPVEQRLREIIRNRLNVTFASIKRQMEAKFYEFLRNFIEFYDQIRDALRELMQVVLEKERENFKEFIKKLDDLLETLKKFKEDLARLIQRMQDPNFVPTKDEIIEMKKINLFKVPEYFEESFQALLDAKTRFLDEMKAIPHKIYTLSQKYIDNNGSKRLLAEEKRSRKLQFWDFLDFIPKTQDDLKNIYDKIIDKIKDFMAPIIKKGDFILVLFDLGTKYLENSEDSFVQKMFVYLKEEMLNLIDNHNISLHFDMRNSFSSVYNRSDPWFSSIQIMKGPLRLLLPPDGVNKLMDEYQIFQFTIPIFTLSAGFNLGFIQLYTKLSLVLSFEMYINGEWGWLKNNKNGLYTGELFIELVPTAKIFLGFTVEMAFIFIKFGAFAGVDLFAGDIRNRFTLDYQIDTINNHFFCRSWMKGWLELYPMSWEHGYYYQFLVLKWKRIRIKIWFIKFYIWIPYFTWGRKHITRYVYKTFIYRKDLYEREFFKKSLYYLDQVEVYLINGLGVA